MNENEAAEAKQAPAPVKSELMPFTAADFDISEYITDPKAEIEGVWRSLGKNAKGNVQEVKLARIGNDDFNDLLRKKQKANATLLEQNDAESSKLATEINEELLSKTIIKGMRINGQEIAYTPAIGLALLRQSKDFHARIRTLADQAEAYRLHNEEESAKS